MSDSQSTSSSSASVTESEDLGVIPETVISGNNVESNKASSNIVFTLVDNAINIVCHRYDIERPQVCLGIILLSLLFIVSFFISFAWKYYSPIILNFSIKEEQERARRLIEKERKSILMLNEKPSKPSFEPVSEGDVLKRLRSFLPQLAAANHQLSSGNVNQIDMDVKKVALDLDESDTSSSSEVESTDEEQESEEESRTNIEFDLSVFRAKDCVETSSFDVQVVDKIPEGFEEIDQECTDVTNENGKKVIIEEI
uniref:Uncharacterized protein n=1 Tax=Heterorhabditis bacteriophora TaxID=37862 RepID=A0A1I7XAV2_HETBA